MQQPKESILSKQSLVSNSETYVTPKCKNLASEQPTLSFVVPVMNEEETLEELYLGISEQAAEFGHFEVIFIDDGSTDSSWDIITALVDVYPDYVRGIKFRSNRGKAAALQTGFELVRGQAVFTMDADLQDDPKEIPRFISKLNEGFDLVSGYKAKRHDPWHKVLPSRVFNRMLSHFSKVSLHDHNCGFKCYRQKVVKSLMLFGELHRMTPSLSGMQGFRVTEIVVEHHARRCGVSKYGVERFIRGFSDMLTMGFLRVYRERPSHFTNYAAAQYFLVAVCLFLAGCFVGTGGNGGLMYVLAAFCFLGMGGACMIAGLLVELLIRQKFETPSCVVVDTGKSGLKRELSVRKVTGRAMELSNIELDSANELNTCENESEQIASIETKESVAT
ncbi:MAG: glycosyltransferase family 2 protein [Planctomycetota bacterium]